MLLASFVEVTVRASEPKAGVLFLDRPVQSPLECYDSENECLMGTTKERRVRIKDDACMLTLDENSSVRRRKESDFQLLAGQLLLDCKGPFALSAPQGDMQFETGRYLVSRDISSGAILLRVLEGQAKVVDRSGQGQATVVAGLELRLGKIGSSARVELSPPRGFDIVRTIKSWEQLESVPRQKFLKMASDQILTWKENVSLASDIQKTLVEREVASLRAQRDAQEQHKKAVVVERKKVKDMLMRRTFE